MLAQSFPPGRGLRRAVGKGRPPCSHETSRDHPTRAADSPSHGSREHSAAKHVGAAAVNGVAPGVLRERDAASIAGKREGGDQTAGSHNLLGHAANRKRTLLLHTKLHLTRKTARPPSAGGICLHCMRRRLARLVASPPAPPANLPAQRPVIHGGRPGFAPAGEGTGAAAARLCQAGGRNTFQPVRHAVKCPGLAGPAGRTSPWLNWIERRPPEPKVTGSNPVGDISFALQVLWH